MDYGTDNLGYRDCCGYVLVEIDILDAGCVYTILFSNGADIFSNGEDSSLKIGKITL